ncbi:unnamed protein product [Periconia digitata]|uniref:NmrA-like domain-containing protein n=1 Tax=Periconia digitata TaxID=1303443 RepID=A0A9W4XWE2_9PLEO|nr:unnamed protein product [Periconia digitata]
MAGSINHIRNVAIVGAGGNSGQFMTEELLKTGKHTVTALTRPESKTQLPEGVTAKHIDYDHPKTIVDALRGQDALVITLSAFAPHRAEEKLIRAAAEAEVSWILPNEWSPDSANEALVKDVFVFQSKVATRKLITELGKSSFISVSTGFWYEWSLAIGAAFGIDFQKRQVTFFDDGNTRISISTWAQVGRCVAGLLSLPVESEGSGKASLKNYANQVVYTNSFTVSQKEMFDSVLRVTGTQQSDWTIESELSEKRYKDGVEQMKSGDRMGFAKMMYTRVFFKDGAGDIETSRGTVNAALSLPKESLDEATKRAEERSKIDPWG